MKRREFLKTSIAVAAPAAVEHLLGSLTTDALAAETESAVQPTSPGISETRRGEMIYRPLGRTGEMVSLLGLGGYHVANPRDRQESVRIIRSAIDHGVNFMDNCWDYHNGDSEVRMGEALEDGYRKKVFLMTKIDGRTKQSAARQIEESLKRLQTDCIDLLQFHEIIRLDDPDRIFAAGGGIEAAIDAQKAGKIRFIGFTGHKDPRMHLRMLDVAARHQFRFDAVQMPLNVMDAHFRSFRQQVVPVLVKEQIGVLGMKPLGGGGILASGLVKPVECLHYAMSLPTSTVITGIDTMQILQQGLDAVRTFQQLQPEQMTALLQRTANAASEGRYELFKTSEQFDGTTRNPHWLG